MSESRQDAAKIREAVERNDRVVTARPSVGKGTAVTSVHWRGGLSCEVVSGTWRFNVGMSDNYGGADEAPNPGVYGRAALGSCLAVGYAMWAARLGVPLRALSVDVHADYDVRGELGIDDDVRPGYLAMRYDVTIDSEAPQEEVLRMLDTAEKYSSYLDDFRNPVPVTRTVRFASSQEA
ncbi:MAG: OsmC family protein [Gemmatimonadaceae bacterium]